MTHETIDTLVIGAGQAGLAASAHLSSAGVPHLVLERGRIAERWRSWRWDSLVANGPAWHDRFPPRLFGDHDPDSFVPKEGVADYFEGFAAQVGAPVRCGVAVTRLTRDGAGFVAQTSAGMFRARNVVCATGPFQNPVIPPLVPDATGIVQMHSTAYRNPDALPPGAVLVVGAGSSGSQIADELSRTGRRVFLSVGPHGRPPRRYRGQDYCWWLGVLGVWDAVAPMPGTEHITISVSGAYGGHTMDFRRLAAQGVTLLGRADAFADGALTLRPDLQANIARGDADYLDVLDRADAYAADHGLDLPPEPEARHPWPDPTCLTDPILTLDLAQAGVTAIIWATGFALDYSWLQVDALDGAGRPVHHKGVAEVPGLYFLGLPWLASRGSSFIWGVWRDAEHVAAHIAARVTTQAA
jgi:putative flavoprotein involved in K+ transport